VATAQTIPFHLPGEELAGLSLLIPSAARNGGDWFFDLCQANSGWRFERNANGEVIVVAPAGGESGDREIEVGAQLRVWARQEGSGRGFGAGTGFRLPNGATRSPDAAWITRDRLGKLTAQEKKKFIPLCPDFVVEIVSPSDRIPTVQEKMIEYMENGARLGWLIDPERRKVYIYRPGKRVKSLQQPMHLSADPEVPGFVLDLEEIWDPGF
jgi:Uma2 family endonuclease